MFKVRASYLPRADGWFDLDYYLREHVRLARQQTDGRLDILRIEVESHSTALLDPALKLAPCVFCLYFREHADVDAFRAFLSSPAVEPLRADVPRYTNCELEWTVCEVREV
jgi:hypothetical protein